MIIILRQKCDQFIDGDIEKLTKIFQRQDTKFITLVHMKVPCCSGIEVIVKRALEKAQKDIKIENITITMNGKIK